MREWRLSTSSPEETRALGRLLGELLPDSALLLLSGDLGAGKTALTQGIARGLGVPEDEAVTSPSYTLMNQYAGRVPLFHFDLYRLEGSDDLLDLGFEEYLAGSGVTVVEWADRAAEIAQEALRLHVRHDAEDVRRFTFRAQAGVYADLLGRLASAWEERGRG